jgi:hypothetical protein
MSDLFLSKSDLEKIHNSSIEYSGKGEVGNPLLPGGIEREMLSKG